jgi:hypothetical protein
MRCRRLTLLLAGVGACLAGHAATPPSIEEFASRPSVEGVAISPDGRYLALIQPRSTRQGGSGPAQFLIFDTANGAALRFPAGYPDRAGAAAARIAAARGAAHPVPGNCTAASLMM